MRRDLLSSLLAVVVLTVALGLAYPLAITGIAQVAFPGQADGSQVTLDGRVVGSELIGQEFKGMAFFHSRPSATGYSGDVTFFGNARGHGGQGQRLRIDVVELVPRERHRYLGAGPRPHGPGPDHGLVGRVLVEVDEHALAPLLLPPGGGGQVGPAALQLTGQGNRRLAHNERVLLGPQPHVDVDAVAAGGLGVALDAELVEQRPRLGGRLLDHGQIDAGRGVEIDPQLIGVVGVGRQVGPHVQADAAEVHGPHDVGDVGRNQRLRGRAVGRLHGGGLQPVGRVLGHALLEERRSAGPVRVALHQHRAATEGTHQRLLDRQVVVGEIELGLATLREERLRRIRQDERAAGRRDLC